MYSAVTHVADEASAEFRAPSPLTPGTRPVCGPPRVPHAHHEESGHPACLQQLLPWPHLPHRCDPIGVSSHQTAIHHRLHCLPLCWLRNDKHTELFWTYHASLLIGDTQKNMDVPVWSKWWGLCAHVPWPVFGRTPSSGRCAGWGPHGPGWGAPTPHQWSRLVPLWCSLPPGPHSSRSAWREIRSINWVISGFAPLFTFQQEFVFEVDAIPWTYKELLLGVSLLQEGAPKLSRCSWAAEEQHSIPVDRQAVVHDNIHPSAKSPEPEVKDSSIQVRALRIPLLFGVVRDHLGGGEERRGDEMRWGDEGRRRERRTEESNTGRTTVDKGEKGRGNKNSPPSSTGTAQMLSRRWLPPSSSYPDCLGASHECWCHRQTDGDPYISPGVWSEQRDINPILVHFLTNITSHSYFRPLLNEISCFFSC